MINSKTSHNKIILGINRGHNSSVSLIKGNELLFHIENERLSNIKYDEFAFNAINKIVDYVDYIDYLAVAGVHPVQRAEMFESLDYYSELILRLGKSFYNHGFELYDFSNEHHKLHAACAFYNSGFDTALCIIKDGMGSEYPINDKRFLEGTYGRELSSSFIASYPNDFKVVRKHIGVNFSLPSSKYYISEGVFLSNSFSEGLAFQKTAKLFNFHELDAGKVMGMSSFGTKGKFQIYKDGVLNTDIFQYKNNDLKEGFINVSGLTEFEQQADFARDLQEDIQQCVLEEILDELSKTRQKNLCLSGGFFLNCVANYHILKSLPSDVNVYIEPLSSDAGTSLGAALIIANSLNQIQQEQKSIYYGPTYKVVVKTDNQVIDSVTSEQVADLIAKGNIVAMFQGRSEAGPRALGNRSILYDPRDPKGKDKVNTVKKREWFRPFAATVLKENASEWFDLYSLNESLFMMYAVDAKQDKKHLIPAVLHVDDTCRIQTLTKTNNLEFYKVIEQFKKITGIPMVLNTSFNLAGDCINETVEQAINTLNNSQIDYLYLPEHKLLIKGQ